MEYFDEYIILPEFDLHKSKISFELLNPNSKKSLKIIVSDKLDTMDLLIDMMPDENVVYNVIEEGQSNEYYQGHAEHILKNIDSVEHYFHFVNTILKNYHTLSKEQKDIIQDSLGIQPKIVEKVVVKEKIVYKQSKKAKLNTYDDY